MMVTVMILVTALFSKHPRDILGTTAAPGVGRCAAPGHKECLIRRIAVCYWSPERSTQPGWGTGGGGGLEAGTFVHVSRFS